MTDEDIKKDLFPRRGYSPIVEAPARTFKREVICSYKLFDFCKKQGWKNREIIPDIHVAEDEFYYFGRMGRVRRVCTKNRKIFKHIWAYCEALNMDVPTVFQEKVRQFK